MIFKKNSLRCTFSTSAFYKTLLFDKMLVASPYFLIPVEFCRHFAIILKLFNIKIYCYNSI